MTGESSQPPSGMSTTTATAPNKDGAVTHIEDCGDQTTPSSPSRRRISLPEREMVMAYDENCEYVPISPSQLASDFWYGCLSPPGSPRKARSLDPATYRKLAKARRDVANDANFQSKLQTASSSPMSPKVGNKDGKLQNASSSPKSPVKAGNEDGISAARRPSDPNPLMQERRPSDPNPLMQQRRPSDPDPLGENRKQSLAEEVEIQRRYFYGEVSCLEVRVKVGMIIVFSLVVLVCVCRLPIGDIRHGLSALMVLGITWQSFCQVRELCVPESESLLSSFSRRTCIVWLVLVTGVLASVYCFVDSLWHTGTRVYGEELVVMLSVGLAYLMLDLIVLGIFVWGRISVEKLESTLEEQLDAEMDVQLDSVARKIGDDVERIQRWTYRLSMLVLLATFCLLYAVPRLIRLIYPFQHGMFSLTMGTSMLMIGVMFIEQPEPEYASLFDEEFHIIRSTSSTVFGSFFLFIGLVLFQPEPEAHTQAKLLRGAILLGILCLIDITSMLTKTRLSMRSLPTVTDEIKKGDDL